MPVKSPYSHVIQPPSFVEPIDLSIYTQGVQHQESQARQNLSDISATYNNVFNIPTYGKDREVLDQKQQEMKDELSQMNLSNLGSLETASKIKNLIGKYASTPDISGIAQRYYTYQNELKKEEEATKKGETYISPLKRQAEKYYSGNEYIKDKRFNGSGFVAADNEEWDKIAKNTPEFESFITKGNYDIHQKGKAESALASNAYNAFKTNPKFYNQLNDQFQQNLENVDINSIHNQGIEGVKQLFPHLPPEAQQQALAKIEEGYQLQQNNPHIENAWKDKLKDDFFKDQALMYAKAKTYVNTVGMEANQFAKDAIDFQQAKDLIDYRAKVTNQYKQVAGNTKIDPVRRARLVSAATQLGTDISDPNQPDGYISNEALDDLGVLKTPKTQQQEDKAEIILGEKSIKKSDVISNINSGNKELIKQVIKQYVEDTEDGEDINVNDDGTIDYEQKGGVGNPIGWDKHITKQQLIDKINGTSTTTNTKTVSKKLYSPSTEKTKIVYSDGTEEIVDGKQ